METIFSTGLLEYAKIIIVSILIYTIIYALLTKIEIISKDSKINAVIALLIAIIISFTGIVSYAINYAINLFTIIFFIIFLLFMLLMFLGVEMKDITKQVKNGKTMKSILIAFAILFSIIVLKGFFALNNTYDINDPNNNSYQIDASYNTGVDDITNTQINQEGFFKKIFNNMNSDFLNAALFLAVLGGFVWIIGK